MHESNEERTAAAIRVVARQALGDIGRAANVRIWTARHPWIAAAGGMTAGFAAGETVSAVVARPAATEAAPMVRPIGGIVRFFHALFALFLFGARTLVASAIGEILAIVKRRDNWFPPR
jgi:hypothetical protein